MSGGGGGGGGGGDGGAAQRAAQEEARKQAAREAVNKLFGYGQARAAERRPIYGQAPAAGQAASAGFQARLTDDEPVRRRFGSSGEDRDIEAADSAAAPVQAIIGYEDIPGEDPAAGRAAREAQIAAIGQSNLDLNRSALDEQKAEAARKLKFALARQGQRGGSADVDESSNLQKTYQDQLRRAVAGADEIGANLRTADEEARLRLLGQVEAGADQGSLLSGAADTLRSNVDRASAAARSNIVSGAFDDIGSAARESADKRARAKAQEQHRAGSSSLGGSFGGNIGRY